MKPFALLPELANKATRSRFWLWLLNRVLWYLIPFNRPHRFQVAQLEAGRVVTRGRWRRANHNHVKGIHACGIATIAEFAAGLVLLLALDPSRYRLLMSKLEVEYHYQAKEDILAESSLDPARMQAEIIAPLADQESVSVIMESRIVDLSGNHIATARTTWQIKRWEKVRTQV